MDMTNVKGTPVNSDFSKQSADEKWGEIQHPPIQGLANMILKALDKLRLQRPTAVLADLSLWKKDLNSAYTLLSVRPDCASKFGVPIIGALGVILILIFLCGVFGWDATPASFQVVTRTIVFEAKLVTEGEVEMYVDDGMGCAEDSVVRSDMGKFDDICCQLFNNPQAVQRSKDACGKREVFIGYVIDLNTGMVSVSEKNLLRALWHVACCDLEGRVSVKEMQRLASLGSRYSMICVELRPFYQGPVRGS